MTECEEEFSSGDEGDVQGEESSSVPRFLPCCDQSCVSVFRLFASLSSSRREFRVQGVHLVGVSV